MPSDALVLTGALCVAAGAMVAVGVICGSTGCLLAIVYVITLFVGTGRTPYDRASGSRVTAFRRVSSL